MRLFVALRPRPFVRQQLATMQSGIARARWQNGEQLHLTMRFFGEVERPQAADLEAALSSIHAPSPVVAIAGVGRFAARAGEALWAGLAPREPLVHLHRKINQAGIRAGLPPERRAFLPHITLARGIRGDPAIDRWLATHATTRTEAFALDHLILYESLLAREGAVYVPLGRWSLARSA